MRRSIYAALLLWAAVVAGGAAQAGQQQSPPAPEDLSQFLPPGGGKALVEKECSTCHDLAGIVRMRATKSAWEAVVLDMVGRGAPLMVEEADTVTAYLAEVFGPEAPPLVDVNSAGRDELTKLPGLTPATADLVLAHRKAKGPFASREEFRTVARIDAQAFEKMKWYVRAHR